MQPRSLAKPNTLKEESKHLKKIECLHTGSQKTLNYFL